MIEETASALDTYAPVVSRFHRELASTSGPDADLSNGRRLLVEWLCADLDDLLNDMKRYQDLEDRWACLKDSIPRHDPNTKKFAEGEMERLLGEIRPLYSDLRSRAEEQPTATKLALLGRLMVDSEIT